MKKIALFLIIIFITGCEATYTIDIDNDFNEITDIIPANNNELLEIIEYAEEYPALFDEDYLLEPDADNEMYYGDVDFYKKSVTDKVEYSYKFQSNYGLSYIATMSANNFVVSGSGYENNSKKFKYGIIVDRLKNIFNNYDQLTKITINIKTNKEVINHNADSVNGNTYTWFIDRNNAKKNINFHFLSDEEYEAKNDTGGNGSKINPYNPEKNNNKKNNNSGSKNTNSNNNKKSNSFILYLLIPLFFILLFVIIKFRDSINKK